jgi:hypothetical protein
VAHVAVRPRDPELAVALHQLTNVDQDHSNHFAVTVEVHGVALWRWKCLRRHLRVADAEVEHIATIVVVVLVERNARNGRHLGGRGVFPLDERGHDKRRRLGEVYDHPQPAPGIEVPVCLRELDADRRLPKPKVAGSRPVVRLTGTSGNQRKSPANGSDRYPRWAQGLAPVSTGLQASPRDSREVRWNRASTGPILATSRSSPPAWSSGESMSGASDASTGAAPPVDAPTSKPPTSARAPCPSYRLFVQKALVGIIKVGDHAEPLDASRSGDPRRSSVSSSPRDEGGGPCPRGGCLGDARVRLLLVGSGLDTRPD